jgi:cobyrinic acid a,c-diamide synthase
MKDSPTRRSQNQPLSRAGTLPRLVVTAPASGCGKTTVATGLIAALHRRGLVVSPHKVGPDYIDPGYHALACDRVGRNLDPWLVGRDRIVPLLLHGAATPTPADVAVIEGVMGLFDGACGLPGLEPGFASTAQVAQLTGSPVVVVLDVRAQARTAAAVVFGLARFDPRIWIGGVILNRVGSVGHERMLRAALAEIGVPVLGAIAGQETLDAPSRHLGLVPVAERATQSLAVVDSRRSRCGSCRSDAVLALAGSAPLLQTRPGTVVEVGGRIASAPGPVGGRRRCGVHVRPCRDH